MSLELTAGAGGARIEPICVPGLRHPGRGDVGPMDETSVWFYPSAPITQILVAPFFFEI